MEHRGSTNVGKASREFPSPPLPTPCPATCIALRCTVSGQGWGGRESDDVGQIRALATDVVREPVRVEAALGSREGALLLRR